MCVMTPCRPRRRTALVARELKRYNIYIAALSETRFHGEDSITETGEGYTFFWKGLPEGSRLPFSEDPRIPSWHQ